MQILGSLDKASETEKNQTSILLDGVEISGMNDKAISKFRNENIGFIFQFHQLLPEFSALENVCMPAMIAGKSLKEATPRALELLSFLG